MPFIRNRYFLQVERTALHYAMSVDQVEALSTILIGYGAKRIAKDLVNTMLL